MHHATMLVTVLASIAVANPLQGCSNECAHNVQQHVKHSDSAYCGRILGSTATHIVTVTMFNNNWKHNPTITHPIVPTAVATIAACHNAAQVASACHCGAMPKATAVEFIPTTISAFKICKSSTECISSTPDGRLVYTTSKPEAFMLTPSQHLEMQSNGKLVNAERATGALYVEQDDKVMKLTSARFVPLMFHIKSNNLKGEQKSILSDAWVVGLS